MVADRGGVPAIRHGRRRLGRAFDAGFEAGPSSVIERCKLSRMTRSPKCARPTGGASAFQFSAERVRATRLQRLSRRFRPCAIGSYCDRRPICALGNDSGRSVQDAREHGGEIATRVDSSVANPRHRGAPVSGGWPRGAEPCSRLTRRCIPGLPSHRLSLEPATRLPGHPCDRAIVRRPSRRNTSPNRDGECLGQPVGTGRGVELKYGGGPAAIRGYLSDMSRAVHQIDEERTRIETAREALNRVLDEAKSHLASGERDLAAAAVEASENILTLVNEAQALHDAAVVEFAQQGRSLIAAVIDYAREKRS